MRKMTISFLLATVVTASASAADVYFAVHGVVPALAKTPTRTKAPSGSAQVLLGSRTDHLLRTDERGQNEVSLLDTNESIRSFSVASDGSILCHVIDRSDRWKPASKIMLLKRNGDVVTSIDFRPFDLRVIGTPVLIDGGKRIGLTVCQITDSLLKHDAPAPDLKGQPAGKVLSAASDRAAAMKQWDEGNLPNPPVIATIDLQGRDPKRLTRGGMATWSPDGKTILFTQARTGEAGGPVTGIRLATMNADGTDIKPLGLPGSADASFSPDGKRIAYIRVGSGDSEVWTCDARGGDAKKISQEQSVYASPRWLADGSAVEVARYHADFSTVEVNGYQPLNSVWVLQADGSSARKVSPDPSGGLHGSRIDGDSAALIVAAVRRRESAAERPETVAAAEKKNRPEKEGRPGKRRKAAKKGMAPRGEPTTKEEPSGLGDDPRKNAKPIPEGMTIQYEGTKVFLRSSSGEKKPMPDGVYRLPSGGILYISGGRKTVPNF